MHRIRRVAERLAQEAAEAAHIAALGLVVTAGTAAGQAKPDDGAATERGTTMAQPAAADRPLERQLAEFRQAFLDRADAEQAALYQRGIDDVADLGIVGSALDEGDAAPMFSLPDATGASITLEALLADGPVVVTFYRGGWCPYCNIQLRAYQDRLDEITQFGASLVAISPEVPDETLSTSQKNRLAFHVLSDAGNTVADDFGIRYRLPDELIEAFTGRLDLESQNGDGSWTLPLAATYVIDGGGTIVWAYLSADYRERAEPQDVIDVLARLKDES